MLEDRKERMEWLGDLTQAYNQRRERGRQTGARLYVHISCEMVVEMALTLRDDAHPFPDMTELEAGISAVYDPGLEGEDFLVLTYYESQRRLRSFGRKEG